MSAVQNSLTHTDLLTPAARAALRAGIVGNWIDNIHVFLPLTALAPAMAYLVGPYQAASTGALVVIAMLLGRPLGGIIFGRVSDRIGRAPTTRLAIAGTAACALLIACLPSHNVFGAATLWLLLGLRFVGGIFVAGEYSAAIPLAMEWSRPSRRGLASGTILSMAPWAQATVAASVGLLLVTIGPDSYARWGWRAMFVIAALLSLGMLSYYSRHVLDAPNFHRATRQNLTQGSVRDVILGAWSANFWQCFMLMSGLWLLTNSVVLILTSRLGVNTGLAPTQVSWAMALASGAQAIAMAFAGHLSSLFGRRRVLIGWGALAVITAPWLLRAALGATTTWQAAGWAALAQVCTVAAYGPVAAYLSERFPTQVRSTGYGMAYSLSLILPALYPFYLPTLSRLFGQPGDVMALAALGGILLLIGAALGPAFKPSDVDCQLDQIGTVEP